MKSKLRILITVQSLIYFLILSVVGCGGLPTKSTYKPIELPVVSKPIKKTITVSCLDSYDSFEGRTARTCPQLDVFKEELEKSGYFKNVFSVKYEPDDRRTKPIQLDPKSDLYLEIYSYKGYLPLHSIYNYWAFFHIASLGLIPMRTPNSFHYELTLYDSHSKELKKDTITNDSSIWYWTPLIFANGLKLFNTHDEFHKEAYRNAIRHYLSELQTKGVI